MKKATIKIKRKYNDTELKRLVGKGEQLEVSLERAKVLCDKGFADIVEVNHYDKYEKIADELTKENELLANRQLNYSHLTVSELKEITKEKGIKVTGLKKQEIIDKLLEL